MVLIFIKQNSQIGFLREMNGIFSSKNQAKADYDF